MFRRWDWNQMSSGSGQGNTSSDVERAPQSNEEQGAVGGHTHKENGYHYNCPACKKEEGHFVEQDIRAPSPVKESKEKKKNS